MDRLPHFERLPKFLLLSFTAHLLLLAGFGAGTVEVRRKFLGQPVLQVQMQGTSRTLPPSHVPRVSAIGDESVEPADHHSSLNAASRNDNLATMEESIGGHRDRDGLEMEYATETGVRNQLLGELQTSLSRYLVYPPLARSRGWEGTVLLGLRVASDGRLDKIRVEHSSGYAVLDNSALNSLNRLGRLTGVSAWLNGHAQDMQLPVIYRLIDN